MNANEQIVDAVVVDKRSSNPEYKGEASFEERNEVLKTLANAAGIRLPNTIAPEGDSLLPSGVAAHRALQGKIAALPNLKEGLNAIRHRVALEKPKDVEVPIQHVLMEPTRAGLYGKGQNPEQGIGYTENGFNHVLAFNKPATVRAGYGPVLLALPPKIRSEAFNYFSSVAHRPDVDKATLRTFLSNTETPNPRRIIRAVVSDRYSAVDDLNMMQALAACVPDGAKLRLTRDLDRTDVEILWPAMERQLVVGDVALISLRLVNSETKQSSIRVMPQLLRVLCYNFTVAWSTGQEDEIVIRHIGEAKKKLGEAIVRALAVVEPFVRAFGDAYKTQFPKFATTRGEVLQRFVKKFQLPAHVADEAARLWDMDGSKSAGDTLAGLVHSVTAASRALTMEDSADVEKAAGRVVVQGWDALTK